MESMSGSFSGNSGNEHSRTSNESNSWNEDRFLSNLKRKRVDGNESGGSLGLSWLILVYSEFNCFKVSALKRRLLDNSRSSNSSTHSPFNGVNNLPRTKIINRANGSLMLGDGIGATPSLCSDNDNDTEDKPPATPPLPPTSQNSSLQIQAKAQPATRINKPNEFARRLVSKDIPKSTIAVPERVTRVNDAFSSRRPSSPLPPETPRRPRPPARTHNLRTSPRKHLLQEDLLDSNAISFHPENESTPAVENTGNKLVMKKQLTLEDEIRNASSDYGSEELALKETDQTDLGYEEEEQQLLEALNHGAFVGIGQRNTNEGFMLHGGGGGVPIFDPLVSNSQNPAEPVKGKKKGRSTSVRGRGRRKSKRT